MHAITKLLLEDFARVLEEPAHRDETVWRNLYTLALAHAIAEAKDLDAEFLGELGITEKIADAILHFNQKG